MLKKQTLIKLTLNPRQNYHGPVMVDYKIVNGHTATILREFVHRYKKEIISFYNGTDESCNLECVTIEIFEDSETVNAFNLLNQQGVIVSSFYIYDIIVEALMIINEDQDEYAGEFFGNVSDDQIAKQWSRLQL